MTMLCLLIVPFTMALVTNAFAPVVVPLRSSRYLGPLYAKSTYQYNDIADVGYAVLVKKPLGVVFGENENPFFGLVVDEVEPDMNGKLAGLRVGDQLLAINGKPVVGVNFDSAMAELVAADGALELQMYRGSVRSLYVILLNKKEDSSNAVADEGDDDDEAVIMDENYESPVQIDISQFEDKPLTPGDVLKAFKKIGSMLKEGEKSTTEKQEAKPKGGFFGLFGGEKKEDFFLDDDDASSLKRGGRSK